jgi:type I restriction enzyme, S subunit
MTGGIQEGRPWKPVRLRFLASIRNSNVDKKSYDGQRSVRLCNYTDVYYNERITTSEGLMEATATEDEIRKFTLLSGDVIITKDSESPDDIGIPALVVKDLQNVVCGYHLTQLRAFAGVTPEFLFRALQATTTRQYLEAHTPGVTRFGLNQETIGSIPIPLPPVVVQKRVASYLDRATARIDALVAKKTRFIELLREKRQTLITHAVTKGLDPDVPMKDSGVEWLGQVPVHWEIGATRRFCNFNPSKSEISHRPRTEQVSFLPMEAIGETGGLDMERVRPIGELETGYSYFADGDVVLAKITPCFENGKGAAVNGLHGGVGFGTTELIVLRPSGQVTQRFLWWLLSAAGFRRYAEGYMQGSAGQKRVQDEWLKGQKIAIPPMPEQGAIVAHLDRATERIDVLIAKTERSIELLQEHRAALITAAVTGKIDLRNAA